MAVDRRRFLAGIGAALLPWPALAAPATAGRFLAARGTGRQAQVTLFDGEAGILASSSIPERGHGLAQHGRVAVLVGRRPGRFLAVIDSATGAVTTLIDAPAKRWFNGHAAFSADGSVLFTTESGPDGDGIGRWAVAEGWRRLADWPCHGVEPHELAVSPDGRWLVIANGGLRYGATGEVQGVPGANSALVWLDAGSGALIARHSLPPADADLSLRHVAVLADGAVLVGLQAYGDRTEARPLAVIGSPAAGLRRLAIQDRALHNYVGSVVAVRPGLAALSCPRGNLVLLIDPRRGTLRHQIAIADGCGLAACQGRVLATSGQGGAVWAGRNGVIDRLPPTQLPGAWDNHMLALA